VPWGLLPVGVPLSVLLVLSLGALTTPRAGVERLLAGALLTTSLLVVAVQFLGRIGRLTPPLPLAVVALTTLAVLAAARLRGVCWWRVRWRRTMGVETLPVLLVAAAAVVIAVVAAYYLPIWQWDALGYHLPYVNFALQRGTFADLPADVAYISTYPACGRRRVHRVAVAAARRPAR
jgi:hypothetical protein